MKDFFETMLGQNNAIVTAHPDDETLWASGLPIRFKDRKWTVICCSIPRRDPIRAWKFFDACEKLGAKGRLLPVQESEVNEAPTGLRLLKLEPYDCVVTHNENGEYGHTHHQCVHRAVVAMRPKRLMTFGYRRNGLGKHILELRKDEQKQKMEALKSYDHITPYEGQDIPKYAALIHRYYEVEGVDRAVETYD